MIYELRTYTCSPGKRDAVVELYERSLPLYIRNNVKIIGFWTTTIGRAETFYYMPEYESLADREEKRAKLFKDPDVLKLIQEEATNQLVECQYNTILQPTSYSPLR